MKNKNKNKIIYFGALLGFILGVPFCLADRKIYINEIMYDPKGSDSGQTDWIELINSSDEDIKISKNDFGLIDEEDIFLGSDGVHYKNCHKIESDLIIPAKSYIVIANNSEEFENTYGFEVPDSVFSLSSKGDRIRLSNDRCETFFEDVSYNSSWGGKNNGFTLELDGEKFRESYEVGGTPGKENSKKPVFEKEDSTVRINEILPNPLENEDENEYIEIYNFGEKIINLKNWILRDASSSGKYIFTEDFFIEPGDYEVIYRKDFSFALNNSGAESVFLLNPIGEVISEVSYYSSKENYSYSFDETKWRWSPQTPGEKNIFGKIPEIEIKKPKKAYLNTFTEFEVKINYKESDKTKVTWNFGDGRKSYKQKTRHKYLEKGTYKVSVKVSGEIEDVFEEFEIKVEKYPHPDVSIVEINPNPVGKDSELETITIKNKSKKEINLLGWSVATGWDKLINHPIRESFKIKAGKEKTLTREYSAFSLNNKKTKIELRYPDGKVAYDLKYKSKESIKEGIVYAKKKGGGWEWRNDESVLDVQSDENVEVEQIQQLEQFKQIDIADIGKKSEIEVEDVFEKIEKDFDFIEFPKINISEPIVLGANALWIDENGFYRFIYESPEEEHYAVIFAKEISSNTNTKLNFLLNFLAK